MNRMGHEQCVLTCELNGWGQAVVNAARGVQTDPRVMMVVVIPVKEWLAKSARVLEGTEAFGNSGRYFMVRNCDSR
jgi:hypothetical protein